MVKNGSKLRAGKSDIDAPAVQTGVPTVAKTEMPNIKETALAFKRFRAREAASFMRAERDETAAIDAESERPLDAIYQVTELPRTDW